MYHFRIIFISTFHFFPSIFVDVSPYFCNENAAGRCLVWGLVLSPHPSCKWQPPHGSSTWKDGQWPDQVLSQRWRWEDVLPYHLIDRVKTNRCVAYLNKTLAYKTSGLPRFFVKRDLFKKRTFSSILLAGPRKWSGEMRNRKECQMKKIWKSGRVHPPTLGWEKASAMVAVGFPKNKNLDVVLWFLYLTNISEFKKKMAKLGDACLLGFKTFMDPRMSFVWIAWGYLGNWCQSAEIFCL